MNHYQKPALYKEETINGMEFHIHRLPADVGAWITVLLTAKMRAQREAEAAVPAKPARGAKAKAEKDAAANAEAVSNMDYEAGMYMTASFLVGNLTRQEMTEIQSLCMESVRRIESQAGKMLPMPIFEQGRWFADDLEYDGPTVLELMKRVLAFNIAPFFPAPASA